MLHVKTKEELEKVLAHARKKSFEDPRWFFNTVLKFKPLDWQVEATNAVLDVKRKSLGLPTMINHMGLPRVTIRSCHGTGKTQFLGMLMHLWNFINYGKIACTAPKEAQLKHRLLPRYRRAMRDAPQEYKDLIKVFGKEIKINGEDDWGSILETASDPDNLAGFHDEPQLFLVDEASAKRLDPMFPVVEGALTTPGSVSVEIGNPTRVEGEFWAHHNKNGVKELYFRMHIKPSDARRFIPQEWVDTMRKKYGSNSPIYLIRALGEFAAWDEYILVAPDLIDDAFDIEYEPDGSQPTLVISIDVSDGGSDSTVITAALHYDTHKHILKQKQFYFEPSVAVIESAEAAVTMFEGFGGRKYLDRFIVDAVGVGAGTAGTLIKSGYNVVRNVGGESSDDPNQWRNRRVQNYIALNDAYLVGAITFAPDCFDSPEDEENYRAHLLSIKRPKNGSDKVDDIELKAKIKQDGGESPDRADSVAMQFNGEIPSIVNVIVTPAIIGSTRSSNYDASLT